MCMFCHVFPGEEDSGSDVEFVKEEQDGRKVTPPPVKIRERDRNRK